jgi:hypothetical protein
LIYWDDEAEIATAIYNNHVVQYYIDDYTVKNGHIMLEYEQLLRNFNYGIEEKPIEGDPLCDFLFIDLPAGGSTGVFRAGGKAILRSAAKEGTSNAIKYNPMNKGPLADEIRGYHIQEKRQG